MDIQQPSLKVTDKFGGEDAHEAGEDQQIGLDIIQPGDHRTLKTFAVGIILVIKYQGVDTGASGPFQPVDVGPVAQYCDDLAMLSVQLVDQCLQIAARSGDQYDDTTDHRSATVTQNDGFAIFCGGLDLSDHPGLFTRLLQIL